MPAVIVLKIAADESGAAAEARFIGELHLALSRFRVIAVDDPSGGFSILALAARLALIRDLSKQHNAVATIWVERWTANKVLLNLTAMSTGRALLKIVEVRRGPSAETELAFAAEALLGEAYLFSETHEESAVRQTVEKVTQTVAAKQRDRTRASAVSALTLFGALWGPVYPQGDAGAWAGGGISWMSEWRTGLFIAPGVSGIGGPKARLHDGVIGAWGFQAELGAGIHFRLKRVALGPALGIGVRWQRWDAFFRGEEKRATALVGFRGSLSADAQIRLADTVALAVRLDLAATPNTLEFKRVSTGDTAIETAWLEGGVLVGLRYLFP